MTARVLVSSTATRSGRDLKEASCDSTGLPCAARARIVHARLQGDLNSRTVFSSHRTALCTSGTLFLANRASSAIAVSSRWGERGAPNTTPFPAFQPPLGRARSISISIPSVTRCGARPRSPQLQGTWFRARIAKLVGTTQLTVSRNQGQPYLSGSKRTWRSVVRNFHFQSQFDSFPANFSNQWKPLSLAGMPGT